VCKTVSIVTLISTTESQLGRFTKTESGIEVPNWGIKILSPPRQYETWFEGCCEDILCEKLKIIIAKPDIRRSFIIK
jgi:hypothetical protein